MNFRNLASANLPTVKEQEIIDRCKKGERLAQKLLYEWLSPRMYGVCKRYVKDIEDAQDVLLEAFYKVFDKIDTFKNEGSFEGWVRRIIVNEALMFLRKRHNFNMNIEISNIDLPSVVNIQDELQGEDIMKLLDKLPIGYRTVFNMYVVEGYKHREIADILNISINTSKSQLILAKERLAKMVQENQSDVG